MTNKNFKLVGMVKEIIPARRYGANNDKYSQDFIFDTGIGYNDKENPIRVTMVDWFLRNKHTDVSYVVKGDIITCTLAISGKITQSGTCFNEITVWGIEKGDTTGVDTESSDDNTERVPAFAGQDIF